MFLNAKSILKEIWLIEVVNYKQEWLIKKWFVKVNYLIKSPEPWFPPSGNQETNASSKEYIKCLKKRKDNTQKIKQVDFCVSKILKYFSHLSSKEEILQEFKYRKSIKKICEIIEIMEQIIEELWIDENDDFYIDKKNINRMDIIMKMIDFMNFHIIFEIENSLNNLDKKSNFQVIFSLNIGIIIIIL